MSWVDSPSTRPVCSKPSPTWPWALTRMDTHNVPGQLQCLTTLPGQNLLLIHHLTLASKPDAITLMRNNLIAAMHQVMQPSVVFATVTQNFAFSVPFLKLVKLFFYYLDLKNTLFNQRQNSNHQSSSEICYFKKSACLTENHNWC